MKRSKWLRVGMLVCSGAVLTQFTGCSTILAPTILGFAENVLLSTLFGGGLGIPF